VPTDKLLLDVDRLVNSVDQQDLRTVVSELGKAFAGGGEDLQRLLDAGDRLTLAATDALPETLALIYDGEIVLDTQRDTGPAIKSFSADLADLTETLASDQTDRDLRTVLDRGVVASGELDGLLTENRPAIAGLLTNLVTVGEVTVVRVDGVEQVLATYPSVVAGGYTVVQRNAQGRYAARFGMVMNPNDPPPCTRGYSSLSDSRPEAQDGQVGETNTGAMCAEARGSGINVRGSQNAPYPRSSAGSGLPSSYLLEPSALGAPGSPAPTVVSGSAPSGLSGSAALEHLLLGGSS
jgi:phospholipid/cholesterol/gamma-HCH transport system substrate-binding protein